MIKGLKIERLKYFKASLDFKKGSTGSVGNEEEIVTLLSDEVHSVAKFPYYFVQKMMWLETMLQVW